MSDLAPQQPHNTRLLAAYLFIRVFTGLLLLALQLTGDAHSKLGSTEQETYVWGTSIYIAVCVLTLLVWPPVSLRLSHHRLVGSLLFDISIMLILLLSSGGVSSGLGYLVIVYVAIAAIFIRGRLGLAFAAIPSVIIIGDSIYALLTQSPAEKDLFAAGILGAVLFLTAITFQFLTNKIRTSDLAAATQSAYADHLQELAQAIITRMRTGVIVVDQEGKIELINESALQLLDLPQTRSYRQAPLSDISTLNHIVEQWRVNPANKLAKIHTLASGYEVRISPAMLQLGNNQRTVLYLEDNRSLTQQAQQLKLASLGRLTASIAHEIRNPLGAISHASQLLKESTRTSADDQRLIEIILNHCARVNQIIENTLAISRRKDVNTTIINLAEWLPSFVDTYQQYSGVHINMDIVGTQLMARFDTTHLCQVLTNLCDNGARYNEKSTGIKEVFLKAQLNGNSDTSFIEISDNGPGIAMLNAEDIFDPFYTTDPEGTGLGLYICKELCQINQANLTYKPSHQGGACFRIDFTHHLRMN
jgi:two-component system sensor histidine kinase PilS (NtrC family)